MLSVTANYSREVAQSLPQDLKPGVYYGWAKVDSTPVQKMVANIGWCPFYQNKELTVVSILNLFLFVCVFNRITKAYAVVAG